MKSVLLKAGLTGALLLSTLCAQAAVFTCTGVIIDVYAKSNDDIEVRYLGSNGNEREPVFIYADQDSLLRPALLALRDGKSGIAYTLVLKNIDGSRDTRCHDGSSDNALIALSEVN